MTATTDSALSGEHRTRAVIDQFFTHFGAGDGAALLELFAPGCDFEVAGSPRVPWTGKRPAVDQVQEFVRASLNDVSTQDFQVNKLVVDGQDVVVLGRFAHRVLSTGKTFSGPFALHLTVQDGRIVTYRMYEDSYAAHHAFTC